MGPPERIVMAPRTLLALLAAAPFLRLGAAASSEVLTTPGGVSVSVDKSTAAFSVSVDGTEWLRSSAFPARFFDGGVQYDGARGNLVVKSVGAATASHDPTFGPTLRVDVEWSKSASSATACLTGAIVALQDAASSGIVFEFTLPLGCTDCTAGSSETIGTAWPIFNTTAGAVALASLNLKSQAVDRGAWGPGVSPGKQHAQGMAGMAGGAPLVLWPHAYNPVTPSPGPSPGEHAQCRVTGDDSSAKLTKSRGGYDAYVQEGALGSYTKHAGMYCATTPAHDWAFTGDGDRPTCQSKCLEASCHCFDVLTKAPAAMASATATATDVVPRAVALAPLDNYMAAGAQTSAGESAWGLFGSVTTVAAGWTHSSVLVAGTGVSSTLGMSLLSGHAREHSIPLIMFVAHTP